MNSNDDDLYGDLTLTLDKKQSKAGGGAEHNTKRTTGGGGSGRYNGKYPSSHHGSTTRIDDHNSGNPFETPAIIEENESLMKKIRILEDENLRLKRNIGTLFRTAKNEIKRKDDQIEELQRQQDNHN